MSKFEKIFGAGATLNDDNRTIKPNSELARARRKVDRERNARQEAERLLEEKSRELYDLNLNLKELNDDLERIVRQRTEALRKSIARVESQQKRAEHIARHDALTGLPNRRFVSEHLNKEKRNWQGSALLYIDLDRFKQINDTLGHAAGDALLKEVSNRLRSYSPITSIVARIGGDEFVILLNGKAVSKTARELAETIVRRLPEPINFEGNVLRFGTSVGIAYSHPNHSSHEELMIEADLALYRAKEAGRGCAIEFSEEMRETSRNRKQLSDDLIAALEEDQIKPVYQARVCTKTGQIKCVEALARWYHPSQGTLDPAIFLSIAEDIGRLADIDEVILRQALIDLKQWETDGLIIPRVSVNVSGRRLMQADLMSRLDRLDIPANRISFELLESVFFDSADSDTLQRLQAIRSRGIRIEIDDFGSGHASINGLIAVRPDALKIDRQLVAAALGDEELIELLKAVVTIGHALEIEVIAEGVETASQMEMCCDMGCQQIQGFGISKPLPADQLATLAKKKPFLKGA